MRTGSSIDEQAAHPRRQPRDVGAQHLALDPQQACRMHREFGADPCPSRSARAADVARHLAADRYRFARLLPGAHRGGDQAQHRRVELVIEVRDTVVGAVDRQRVLHQVVGADRQEVKALREPGGRQRRRRHFDHAADRHRGRDLHPPLAQLLAGPLDQDQ